MNEEQMKKLIDGLSGKFTSIVDDAIAKYDAKRKEEEEVAKKKAEEEAAAKKKADEEDALKKAEEEVRKRRATKTAEELEKERYLEACKWNAGIKEFLESNKDYLPEALADIINVLEAKTYGSETEKAQELKRAVVEQFIKVQGNIDILPDSLKSKAEKYAGFTTKEKLDRAADFYDIVETGIHTAKNIKKAEAINKSGGMANEEKDAVKEYEANMLKFSTDTVKGGETK